MHGALEQAVGHLADGAGVLGDGNEQVRHQHAEARMLPARQHLEADRLAGIEVDERLVIGDDLARRDGALDLRLELDPLL